MPEFILPFRIPEKDGRRRDSCNILSLLSKQTQEVVDKHPHLLEYLNMMPIDDYGIPKFYDKLDRSVVVGNNPNLIYPIKEGVFTHILYDAGDGRNTYIPIEPVLVDNLDRLMNEIEIRLLEMADQLGDISVKTDNERRDAFLRCVDEICVLKGTLNASGRKNGGNGKRSANGSSAAGLALLDKFQFNNKVRPLEVTRRQLNGIKYLILRDKLGLGMLDPLVWDKYVEDVSCSGLGVIYLEHKIFHSLKTVINFSSSDDLDQFVMRLAERIRRPVSVHSPIVDATLPDGSRINIVYGSDVSKRGSNFSIRKFSETPLSVLEIIDMGTCDYKMAAYLSIMIGEGMNVFVCGETASGKTTTLNALTTFIHPNAKIVSIEDTPELQVPHQNWIREVVSTTKENSESGVTMFDLLKAALRQRPNEIIIGEIRGAEGAIAFQAMQTGHSVMATFHAASVERLIQRMTGNPINVPKTYMDNLNLAIFQQAVKLPSGKMGRRMTSINEIVGYDPVSQSFSFVESFRWDPVSDKFIFTGDGNSYLLEHKVAPKLGIPPHKKRRIYAEVERRARILDKLNLQGVKNFYDLLKVLAKAQREGLF
ncbi:MAG: type II/IV secretion system ATPase subunit [Dehalococcoidia bacterium]|nr:type II/IV secretion system ATPase subunit [Dehalococcoidia bacterium]MDD5494891.1 type II/IV secretion system ATPase subunit [Dehalococcoidia bacterium]